MLPFDLKSLKTGPIENPVPADQRRKYFVFGQRDVVTCDLTLKVEQAQRWSADVHNQDNDDFMLQHYDDKKGNLECVIVFSLNSLK